MALALEYDPEVPLVLTRVRILFTENIEMSCCVYVCPFCGGKREKKEQEQKCEVGGEKKEEKKRRIDLSDGATLGARPSPGPEYGFGNTVME